MTSSSLLISSGKPEEVFPTNIFSVINECPPLSTEPKLFNTIPTQFLLPPISRPFREGLGKGSREKQKLPSPVPLGKGWGKGSFREGLGKGFHSTGFQEVEELLWDAYI